MLKIILVVTALFSFSTFALKITEVYKITGINVEKSNDIWTGLNTQTGSVVFLRCSTADFDDVARDRVGAFKTSKDCLEFIELVKKHASEKNPIQIQIGKDFIMEVTLSY
jgi:hypothetical protein